jgi:hypothetical protein
VFTKACHCSLTSARWIHSTPSRHIHLRSILILRPFMPCGLYIYYRKYPKSI